jgi:hypothetical protein
MLLSREHAAMLQDAGKRGLLSPQKNKPMILRHRRYELEYWRIRDLPSDRVVIKENLVSLEEQQGTTTPKAMIRSHDPYHRA